MIPSISINKTDGNLGVVSDTDRILAIVGTSSAGVVTAQAFTNTNDVTATHHSGPLVEAGAYMIELGVPVVLVGAVATTNGAYGTITHSAVLGSATIAAGTTHPDADYDVIVQIVNGGALGTTGITFIYSLDNGVNWSATQALGTSLTMTLDRGVSFALTTTASTFLAGDTFSVTTTAPQLSTSDIATALATLTDYSGEWLRCLVLARADGTINAQADTFAKSFHADGKYPEVITNSRPRNLPSEDRPTYQAALATIAAAAQSDEVSWCADQCEIVSAVDGRRLRMPASIPYAARLMLIDDSQDAAAKSDGSLPGVFLTTAAGARNYHDERRYPGLDALGMTTLRSWGGRPVTPGAYVNNPRLISGPTSDYQFFQLSAIVNRIIESTFQLLQPKLSASVLCDVKTGKIRNDVAQSVEEAVNSELRTLYVDSKKVSGIAFALSRTDDVLGTHQITFAVNTVPLAVIKKFLGKAGLVRVLPS